MTTMSAGRNTPGRGGDALSRLTPSSTRALRAEEAWHRAEEANRSKLEWLRVVSHELRTPLNAIGGFVQLLKSGARGEVPEAMRGDLDRIERNHQHMTRLIDEVLRFARLEAGRVHFDIGPVSVSRILLDIQDYVPAPERARGRRLLVRPAPGIVVLADEDKVRQVLVNLVANALRHTPADATIEVFVDDSRESQARIVVKDDGPGIPPDQMESVFEPFFQVGRSLNRPAEGLGLGLTIARELARGMGGDLEVRSPATGGAEFALLLRRVRNV